MAVFRALPLMLVAVILYNLLALVHLYDADTTLAMLNASFDVPMFSGHAWKLSLSDFIIVISISLLFVEVVKATRTEATEVINHALSMLVFVVCLVEFITLPAFADSAFFLITIMALFDVVAGFTITIVAARRDFGVSEPSAQ